jgi:hypothetical protein
MSPVWPTMHSTTPPPQTSAAGWNCAARSEPTTDVLSATLASSTAVREAPRRPAGAKTSSQAT